MSCLKFSGLFNQFRLLHGWEGWFQVHVLNTAVSILESIYVTYLEPINGAAVDQWRELVQPCDLPGTNKWCSSWPMKGTCTAMWPTWNQSMVQQLTNEGNFRSRFLKVSPMGLMASTMCSWSRQRWMNILNRATGDPSVCLDLSLCLQWICVQSVKWAHKDNSPGCKFC